MNFASKIEAARAAGLLKACGEILVAISRSTAWYEDRTDRIDQSTFDSLRKQVDEAEALWKAAKPRAKLEAV